MGTIGILFWRNIVMMWIHIFKRCLHHWSTKCFNHIVLPDTIKQFNFPDLKNSIGTHLFPIFLFKYSTYLKLKWRNNFVSKNILTFHFNQLYRKWTHRYFSIFPTLLFKLYFQQFDLSRNFHPSSREAFYWCHYCKNFHISNKHIYQFGLLPDDTHISEIQLLYVFFVLSANHHRSHQTIPYSQSTYMFSLLENIFSFFPNGALKMGHKIRLTKVYENLLLFKLCTLLKSEYVQYFLKSSIFVIKSAATDIRAVNLFANIRMFMFSFI